MICQITGKHIELGETLQTYCREEMDKLIQKFHLTPIHCQILFEKEPHHDQKLTTEISVHLSHQTAFRSHAQGEEPYTCFDTALLRISEQVIRHKNRLDDHHKHHDNHAYKKLSELEESGEARE